MKKRNIVVLIFFLGFIYLWMQPPPDFMGMSNTAMSNAFIGTYVCETNSFRYIVAYKEGIFYEYCENDDLYRKGEFQKIEDGTYQLTGKKIPTQEIVSENRSFTFFDGTEDVVFKKTDEIPIIVDSVEGLAE